MLPKSDVIPNRSEGPVRNPIYAKTSNRSCEVLGRFTSKCGGSLPLGGCLGRWRIGSFTKLWCFWPKSPKAPLYIVDVYFLATPPPTPCLCEITGLANFGLQIPQRKRVRVQIPHDKGLTLWLLAKGVGTLTTGGTGFHGVPPTSRVLLCAGSLCFAFLIPVLVNDGMVGLWMTRAVVTRGLWKSFGKKIGSRQGDGAGFLSQRTKLLRNSCRPLKRTRFIPAWPSQH